MVKETVLQADDLGSSPMSANISPAEVLLSKLVNLSLPATSVLLCTAEADF